MEEIPHAYFVVSGLLVLFCYVCGLTGHNDIIGIVGVSSSVFLMGSPLATLATVLRDKSTDSMPSLSTSMTTWMNAFSWLMYGVLVARDFYVYAPNILGLLLATFQIALYLTFSSELGSQSQSHYSDDALPSSTETYRSVQGKDLELSERMPIQSACKPSSYISVL